MTIMIGMTTMIVYSDPAQDKCRLQGTAKIAEDGPSADLVISLNLIIYPNRKKYTTLKNKRDAKNSTQKRSLSKLKDYKYPFKVNLFPSCDFGTVKSFSNHLLFLLLTFVIRRFFRTGWSRPRGQCHRRGDSAKLRKSVSDRPLAQFCEE